MYTYMPTYMYTYIHKFTHMHTYIYRILSISTVKSYKKHVFYLSLYSFKINYIIHNRNIYTYVYVFAHYISETISINIEYIITIQI